MVQEFHVLRCFACETFQVQQVKKAKKWSCKMCGEKQSVVKEFGRGSGADCRRHVQKLNSLRGKMLEEENESAWSRWEEDEECDHDQGQALSSAPQQTAGESRWSKYVETMSTLDDDDEEEDENVSTESKCSGSQRNIRKRKRGRSARVGFDRQVDHEEDDDGEEGHGQVTGAWKCNKGLVKPLARTRMVNASSTWEDGALFTPAFYSRTPTPSAAAGRPTPSAVPSRNFHEHQHRPIASTGPSASAPVVQALHKPLATAPVKKEDGMSTSCPVSKANRAETKSSKWAIFLTSPSNEDQEDEGFRDDEHKDVHWRDADMGSDVLRSVRHRGFHSTAGVKDQNNSKTNFEKTPSSGLFGSVLRLTDRSGLVDKLKSATACFGFVSTTNQMRSPTLTTQTIGQEKPVRHQPPPSKRPCPGLAVSSLFQTNEDFDDTF